MGNLQMKKYDEVVDISSISKSAYDVNLKVAKICSFGSELKNNIVVVVPQDTREKSFQRE